MTLRTLAFIGAASVLAACSGATETAQTQTKEVGKTIAKVSAKVAGEVEKSGADLSALPAGTYKSEQGHAYVAFTYSHQGFSNPILRWGTTDATVVFDQENPENSTLTVRLPTADIDSGVAKFDDHLRSEGFFDSANYPEITFVSTDISQLSDGYGTLTGELTIKDVTKPFTLTGTVNKVGKHFRSGVDMFGVSATGKLNRAEFGIDQYMPVGADVEIMVEVEFQKAE
jgi:polyisoprenoid-binding protein YceI